MSQANNATTNPLLVADILRYRNSGWDDPVIRSIVKNACGFSPAQMDVLFAEADAQTKSINEDEHALDDLFGGPAPVAFAPPVPREQSINPTQRDPLPLVPAELKSKPNWVRWKLETVDGRLTKIPYQLNGHDKASSTDATTWNTYKAISSDAVLSESQGIGIMTDDSFVGFDLDGCRNPATGEIKEWAQRVINTLDTYTEITPSGYGVRVYAIGQLPDGPRRFPIAPSAGFGDKVGIETYSDHRYFTVSGNRVGEASTLQSQKVLQAYELCSVISHEFPSEKRKTATGFQSSDNDSTVAFKPAPGAITSKLAVLMYGKIISRSPFVVEDEYGSKVEAPSQSEADMSLATLLAIKHGDKPDLIDSDFRESALYRKKWDRVGEKQIQKAIESAAKIKPVQAVQSTVLEALGDRLSQDNTDEFSEASIPAFDASVIKGIYKEIVDETTRGTTLSPQFIYAIAKTIVGAKMTGKIKFADLDVEPLTYLINCGPTGSGKGEAWRRMLKILIAKLSGEMLISNPLSCNAGIKILNSADSGAGLRDAFFEHPADQPIVCYVDEVKSLGHKAGEKKNPEILDVMGELADSTSLSRVKAKKWVKQPSAKTKNDAYLAVVMCVQNSEVITSAFTGRTGVGWYDRLIPEYGVPQEPGDLPPISDEVATSLLRKLNGLRYSGMMMMTLEAKAQLEQFWANQTPEIRIVARLKQHLKLDAYLIAFGRGSKIEVHGNTLTRMVELSDVEDAIKNFPRQLAIRRVLFRGEVPNRVGFYLAGIKGLTEWMRRRLAEGISEALVARSWRDYELKTNARRNNEEDIFARAMETHAKHHLRPVDIQAKNGHTYRRYLPLPEDE